MTKVLHRTIAHDYPVAESGQGMVIRDANGKEYIDASGGAAVSCLGHSHPDVLAAMHAQLDKLAYAHTSFFTTKVAEELAETLIADAPPGIGHVYFRLRRLGGDRGRHEDGAAISCRARPAAADEVHRAAAELSWQHAGSRWRWAAAWPGARPSDHC